MLFVGYLFRIFIVAYFAYKYFFFAALVCFVFCVSGGICCDGVSSVQKLIDSLHRHAPFSAFDLFSCLLIKDVVEQTESLEKAKVSIVSVCESWNIALVDLVCFVIDAVCKNLSEDSQMYF